MPNYKTISKTYDSWGAYLDALRALPPSANTVTSEEEALGWCGSRNVGHALHLAERRWEEGARLVQRIAMPMVDRMADSIEHTDLAFDVTGAAFDVGEHLAGTPECWLTPLHMDVKPCVTIMMNSTVSAGVSQRAIMMKGAAVTALTLTLQAAGYAVRVYKGVVGPVDGFEAGDRCLRGGVEGTAPLVAHRICLTDEGGGPLDADRLMFALAHPSSVRQLDFCLMSEAAGKPYDSLIGRVTYDFPDESWKKAEFYLDRTHLNDADWEDERSVAAWVKRQYESLQITPY